MERSSPLTAMQPHAPNLGHGHWNFGMGPSTGSSTGSMGFGSGCFDFNDLSLRQSSGDYFNLRPSRGVSPTAHLAVDLSKNFHIDRSPQPPTPRRSLFSSNLFGALNCRQNVVTPPPVSSPPCPPTDSMDISPLPHKAPYAAMIQVHSPTPEPTPAVQSALSSASVIPESPTDTLTPLVPVERKKAPLARPMLSRAKALTTTALFTKPSLDVTPQPFKFGDASGLQPPAPLSLEECFTDSPEEMTFPSPPLATGLQRPKSAYQKAAFVSPSNGSPGVRKAAGPYQRPRKQFRRSLSMFEHPADVLNQQKQDTRPACALQAIADADETQPLHLPHFFPEQDTIPRITKETLINVLDGKHGEHFEKLMVVDCRFEYEYKGGHIDGAVNFTNKEELARTLFEQAASPPRTLLVFHCEYSAHRAPIAARYVRGEDRSANAEQYPRLSYPNVYILDGGYSAFFAAHKGRCYPQSYVEMSDANHATACERGLGKLRQPRAKLGRAQTFAFGQHPQLDSSPTATVAAIGSRGQQRGADLIMTMDISPIRSCAPFASPPTRRMCSF